MNSNAQWMPPVKFNATQNIRKVGVEIEFAGVKPARICQSIQDLFQGHVIQKTDFEYLVEGTQLGSFSLELDARLLKQLAKKRLLTKDDETAIGSASFELLSTAAEWVVPWEVVSPPISMENLHLLEPLIDRLRELGGLGTRHALYAAFGLHLNPEVISLETQSILDVMKAFFCLYDWICQYEAIDISRKLTPYINHFEKEYIEFVIDPLYQPSLTQLIDDYLFHNPTRNRSLDLLPLFSYIDSDRVANVIQDQRIKSRPTFHYRLPNCDIDNPKWHLFTAWKPWLLVEQLAHDSQNLSMLCGLYADHLQRLTYRFDRSWVNTLDGWVINNAIGQP